MMSPVDATHDPALASWVESARGHRDFPVQNLPYGVFSPAGSGPHIGVAIGDAILDLSALAVDGLVPPDCADALSQSTLNALFALPAAARLSLRRLLSELLCDASQRARLGARLHEIGSCTLHLPAAIGDYTDFYVGIHHATNVGSLYRPDEPLTVNYKHLPVGYHGRTSSITASGASVVRPHGQTYRLGTAGPDFGVCRELDYELELGVWIGVDSMRGVPVPISEAPEHVAGLCLLNDWSARDLQHWERLPLGPFLGKSFHTSVSPWVVTSEALAPFRVPPRPRPDGDPAPLPYLSDAADAASGQYAISLEACLLTPRMAAEGDEPVVLSRAAARDMYWTIAQLVAHQTSNGCNLRAGDLLGTGTLSGPMRGDSGSLLEITRGGADEFRLPNGETRVFLADGDVVVLRGGAAAEGYVPIGFGTCIGAVAPALSPPIEASATSKEIMPCT